MWRCYLWMYISNDYIHKVCITGRWACILCRAKQRCLIRMRCSCSWPERCGAQHMSQTSTYICYILMMHKQKKGPIFVCVCAREWIITCGFSVSMLLGRGLICIPGCELVDGRLSPPDSRSQQKSRGLVVSRRQAGNLRHRKPEGWLVQEKNCRTSEEIDF